MPFIYIDDFIDMPQGITVAANPERGIRNDPEPGSLSPRPLMYIIDFIDIMSFQLFIHEIRNLASSTVLIKAEVD